MLYIFDTFKYNPFKYKINILSFFTKKVNRIITIVDLNYKNIKTK